MNSSRTQFLIMVVISLSLTVIACENNNSADDPNDSVGGELETQVDSGVVEGDAEVQDTPDGMQDTPEPDEGPQDPDTGMMPNVDRPEGPLRRFEVQNAEARNAICNDGSPAVFYARRGVGDGERKWVIHLKGGGSCYSIESCQRRFENSPSLMSSDGYSDAKTIDGIFNTDPELNPAFYNWTHVHVMYCSSDGWNGDREASPESGGFHYRGKAIVRAVIEDLMTVEAGNFRNLSEATDVIFAGSSAGSNGMKQNLDDVAAMLSHAKVVGLNDASFFTLRLGYTEEEIRAQRRERIEFANSVLDASCVADTNDPIACADSTFVGLYHITTPFFVLMDQEDGNSLDGIEDPEQIAQFSAHVRELLTPLPGAYSPRTGTHVWISKDLFYSHDIEGMSFHDTFANFYFEREGLTNVIKAP